MKTKMISWTALVASILASGEVPPPDTQIAAACSGMKPQVGYAELVKGDGPFSRLARRQIL